MSGGPRFRYYKAGMSRQITPVNLAGWIALTVWAVALVLMIWGISVSLRGLQDPIYRAGAVIGCSLLSMIWLVGGVLWMKARSEIIDADALYDRQKAKNGEGKR
ncbi:hypothetical protein [Qipengyuania sp.]|uniref:hypothetical protein n=1 Tax=Qipengyuania sp. TaxID=2004515 RepID=UPI0035C82D50